MRLGADWPGGAVRRLSGPAGTIALARTSGQRVFRFALTICVALVACALRADVLLYAREPRRR